jgi:hypothetical protein
MSDAELEELLQSEGVDAEGVDALLEWARGRAAELIASAEGDPELGPLLRAGGELGEDRRSPGRRRARGGDEALQGQARVDVVDDDAKARTGRGRRSERRGRKKRKTDEVPVVVEPEAVAPEAVASSPGEREPELHAILHGVTADPAVPQPSIEDEVTNPRGEPSSAGPLPETPAHDEDEIDEIEEIDVEELELVDDESDEPEGPGAGAPAERASSEPPPLEPPREPPPEVPTFGPPDGTDAVPAWRAALFAAESGSDAEALQRIKEEDSGMRPLPDIPDAPVQGERLEAEEDEISHHKIDLSDLDGSPE